jgi:hypothetical protein
MPRQRVFPATERRKCSVRKCDRHARTRCDPSVVGLKLQTEPVIEDPQISVPAAPDRVRPDHLHLLRHHADIDLVAAIIGEAIEADAVVEMADDGDIVLEPHVGPPAASAATAAAEATAAAAHPHAATAARNAATPAKARAAATRLEVRHPP